MNRGSNMTLWFQVNVGMSRFIIKTMLYLKANGNFVLWVDQRPVKRRGRSSLWLHSMEVSISLNDPISGNFIHVNMIMLSESNHMLALFMLCVLILLIGTRVRTKLVVRTRIYRSGSCTT